jgi:hypothetical protein
MLTNTEKLGGVGATLGTTLGTTQGENVFGKSLWQELPFRYDGWEKSQLVEYLELTCWNIGPPSSPMALKCGAQDLELPQSVPELGIFHCAARGID